MKAPFPWFGGKRRVADLVWNAFGNPPNYVEPFAGSLAVLLERPHEPKAETVNDRDYYLANFWRAAKYAPAELAALMDWPVNEADLHARHRHLVDQAEFRARIVREPKFFDVELAAWWCWGICMWIGGGWCAESNWNTKIKRAAGELTAQQARRPNLHASNGVHRKRTRDLAGAAEWQKRPILGRGGLGVHRRGLSKQIPQLGGDSGAYGRGIHASAAAPVAEWMELLAARLRRVRVCCGDWTRVLGKSATTSIGVTAVFLDPPYSAETGRDGALYAQESGDVAHAAAKWAIAHGNDPKFRIALCGYEGEHRMPKSWREMPWKAAGGYAAAAGNTENSERERIWFSPHCERPEDQAELFSKGA